MWSTLYAAAWGLRQLFAVVTVIDGRSEASQVYNLVGTRQEAGRQVAANGAAGANSREEK